ncbi:rhodanese-like domain-containing protein [Streptomyces cinerochromogenes]|uniref:rhodanese-like domain-containing protein n=1 Tax=Streptomyces cinerochromogenes TaxID=66422 RepID=UPI0016714066|nr:rhodanese-like domain-containing protein [Streptomyces cinerochromogenes]GGS81595.1 hypothetical protein GCM10010206_50280 [Streptomyces cinerochromogenes]
MGLFRGDAGRSGHPGRPGTPGDPGDPHEPGGPLRLTVREAAARTGHDGRVAAVAAAAGLRDVREPDECRTGHAPGTVPPPLAAPAAGAGLPAAADVRPMVVICRSGQRSRRTVELLRAQGAEAVDVRGGVREWAEAGLPVVDGRSGNGTVA